MPYRYRTQRVAEVSLLLQATGIKIVKAPHYYLLLV